MDLETFLEEYRLKYVEYTQRSTNHRMRGAEKRPAVGIRRCEGVTIERYEISYPTKFFQDREAERE